LTKIITTLKYLSDHKINTYDLEALFCELFYHLLFIFYYFSPQNMFTVLFIYHGDKFKATMYFAIRILSYNNVTIIDMSIMSSCQFSYAQYVNWRKWLTIFQD